MKTFAAVFIITEKSKKQIQKESTCASMVEICAIYASRSTGRRGKKKGSRGREKRRGKRTKRKRGIRTEQKQHEQNKQPSKTVSFKKKMSQRLHACNMVPLCYIQRRQRCYAMWKSESSLCVGLLETARMRTNAVMLEVSFTQVRAGRTCPSRPVVCAFHRVQVNTQKKK